MPAARIAAAPMMELRSNAAWMISSLDQKPENGGMPMMARYPAMKVMKVITMTPLSAPYLRILTPSFIPCMTDPAPRNSPALNTPWVSRWKIAKTYPIGPSPAAKTMYPIWLIVDPARDFLMSSLAEPMMAPMKMVMSPTTTTAVAAQVAAL